MDRMRRNNHAFWSDLIKFGLGLVRTEVFFPLSALTTLLHFSVRNSIDNQKCIRDTARCNFVFKLGPFVLMIVIFIVTHPRLLIVLSPGTFCSAVIEHTTASSFLEDDDVVKSGDGRLSIHQLNGLREITLDERCRPSRWNSSRSWRVNVLSCYSLCPRWKDTSSFLSWCRNLITQDSEGLTPERGWSFWESICSFDRIWVPTNLQFVVSHIKKRIQLFK